MDPFKPFSGSLNKHLTDQADLRHIPISGTFELLPFCNMRCEMCYIVHENQEQYIKKVRTVDQWEKTIDKAIDEGMLYALLTGGEPFLYPDIKELLRRLNHKPIHVFINTNATLLNRDMVELISSMGIRRLNISLYGASNETYAKMCKNPKGFDQIMKAFQLLKEYKVPFGVHTTLTPANIHDYEALQQVCNKMEVPISMVYYMFPPYRKDKGFVAQNARFTPEEAAHVALRILKDRHHGDDRGLRRQLEANISCFEHPENYSLYGIDGVSCKGGVSNFWVDWRGNISGCGINNIEQIDLGELDFHDAWTRLAQSIASTQVSQKCIYCGYRCICPVCSAAAYTETGSVNGTPEYLCEFAEHYSKLLIAEHERLKAMEDGKIL